LYDYIQIEAVGEHKLSPFYLFDCTILNGHIVTDSGSLEKLIG